MYVIMFKTITDTGLHKTTKKHKFNKKRTFIETTEFPIHMCTYTMFYSNKHIAVSAIELTADRI